MCLVYIITKYNKVLHSFEYEDCFPTVFIFTPHTHAPFAEVFTAGHVRLADNFPKVDQIGTCDIIQHGQTPLTKIIPTVKTGVLQ